MWSLAGVWPTVMFVIFIWKGNGKLDPHWEGLLMLVCIRSPQWRSPVPSCLAWASATHKHSGASSAPGYVDVWRWGGGGQESWFQSPWKATSERASVQTERSRNCGGMILNLNSPKTKLAFSSTLKDTLPHKQTQLQCVYMKYFSPKIWCASLRHKGKVLLLSVIFLPSTNLMKRKK